MIQPSSIGQAVEWLVWLNIVTKSNHRLHVYLPTWDMGIDGIVRNPVTDQMVPVQVKGATELTLHHELNFGVSPDEVADDGAKIIIALADLSGPCLREPLLVVSTGEFKRLAGKPKLLAGQHRYEIFIPFPPGPHSAWTRHAVSVSDLPGHVCDLDEAAVGANEPAPLSKAEARQRGYRGEMEFLRQLAQNDDLNVFHATPDIETDEYLVRPPLGGPILGFQIKTASQHQTQGKKHRTVVIKRKSLHISPKTYFVIFTEDAETRSMDNDCWLIPSVDLPSLAGTSSQHVEISLGPGSHRLDTYRIANDQLAAHVTQLLTNPFSAGRPAC